MPRPRRLFRWLEDTLGQGTVAILMMVVVLFGFLAFTWLTSAI